VAVDDLLEFLREHDMPVPPQLHDGPVRIVVADDEPDMAALIAKAIRTSHPEYEVEEANDGFQAGTAIAANRPDVVILDLRMPGMDGFQVCRLIKSRPESQHATVIAVTAFPSEESEKEILACGAKLCLSKPLDLPELVAQTELGVQEARG
jgi:CheY-like chemotaxis protein